MKQMTAVNVIRIEKGRVDEVAVRFANPKSVHTFPGFIRMEVWKKEDAGDHDELHICTTWEDESHFEHWRQVRAERKAQERAAQPADSAAKPADNPILGAELSVYTTLYEHLPADTSE